MKKILFSFLAALLLSVTTFAADWTVVAEKLAKSVVYIETSSGSCTGFVINTKAGEKGDKDYVQTAAHCEGDDMYADNEKAKVVHKDTKKDLLVLEIDDTGRPALQLAKENPKLGEEVASYGYGWGLEEPMFRRASVSVEKMYIPEDGIGGPFVALDSQFVPGQSGGPVVNAAGQVVLIVQRGGGGVGIGVGAEILKSKVGKYYEKAEVK
jgi:S1-C subfamily serine protease